MRVHLAGLLLLKNNSELLKKCRFMLESFYSVKEWQIPYLTQAEGFLLDSGAFTFMQAGKTGINFDDYIEKYARFVKVLLKWLLLCATRLSYTSRNAYIDRRLINGKKNSNKKNDFAAAS